MYRYLLIMVLLGCTYDVVVIRERPSIVSASDAGTTALIDDSGATIDYNDASGSDVVFTHPFDAAASQSLPEKCLTYDSCPTCKTPYYESIDGDGGPDTIYTLYNCPGHTYCYDDPSNKTIQCY